MTAFTPSSKLIPQGVNNSNRLRAKVVLPLLANLDTVSVTVPDGVPVDAVPFVSVVFDPATPTAVVRDANLPFTNHNQSTGVSLFTADGAVAAGSVLIIEYVSL
jgi:putative alpha-1,2-mannosidase